MLAVMQEGVAHKPWRDREAEGMLVGKGAERGSFEAAAGAMLRGAKGFEHNAFKMGLAERSIVRALEEAAAGQGRDRTAGMG
jgi:xanthine dehydrogenase YagS FAD-binding subunit